MAIIDYTEKDAGYWQQFAEQQSESTGGTFSAAGMSGADRIKTYNKATTQDLMDTFVGAMDGTAQNVDPFAIQRILANRIGEHGWAWHNDSIRQKGKSKNLRPDNTITPEQKTQIQDMMDYTKQALRKADKGQAGQAKAAFPGADQGLNTFEDVNTRRGGIVGNVSSMARELGPFAAAVAGGWLGGEFIIGPALSALAPSAPAVQAAGAATAGGAGAPGAVSMGALEVGGGAGGGIGVGGAGGVTGAAGGGAGVGGAGYGFTGSNLASAGGIAGGAPGGLAGIGAGGAGAAGAGFAGAAGGGAAAPGFLSSVGSAITGGAAAVGGALANPLVQTGIQAGLGALGYKGEQKALSSADKNYRKGLGQAKDTMREYLDPYAKAGLPGLERYESLRQDPSRVTQTPGYQFRLNQGLENLQRQAAARGMLSSGNTLAELTQYSQDYATAEYDRELQRDIPLMNMGAGASSSLATGIGGLDVRTGESSAAREAGQGSAKKGFLEGIGEWIF